MKSVFSYIASVFGIFLAVWLCLRFLLPLTFPFLLGLGLALAAEPMAGFLHRKGAPRALCAAIGVTMAVCFLGILVLLLGAILVRQIRGLAIILPNLEQTARSGLSLLQNWLLGLVQKAPESLQDALQENISGFFSDGTALLEQGGRFVLGLAGNILTHVPDSAFTLGTAVISAFLFSAKLPRIRDWVSKKLPKEKLRKLLSGAHHLRRILGGWLLAQCKLMGVTFSILAGGFLLLRIPYAPVWALLVSIVDALPVLGTGTVLLPWALICFLQQEGARAIGLIGIYLTISLTRSLLEPRFLGRHLGMDPLATLIAMYTGYKLWGFGGLILSPVLAVVAIQLSPNSGKA